MNRVPVVPWSTAAAYFAMFRSSGLGLGDAPGHQDTLDEEVVHQDPEHPAHEGTDDRDPEVVAEPVAIARQGRLAPAGDGGEQPRAEVAGRVDRVARVGA